MEKREERLINFLSDPRVYPHTCKEVQIIQTHISIIAIARPYVYKFKKEVNFGFLDYSIMQKRHEYVRKEFKLNQRLCNNIYIAIVPLFETLDESRVDSPDGSLIESNADLTLESGVKSSLDPGVESVAGIRIESKSWDDPKVDSAVESKVKLEIKTKVQQKTDSTSQLSFESGKIFEYGLKLKYMPDIHCALFKAKKNNLSAIQLERLATRLSNFYHNNNSLIPKSDEPFGGTDRLEKAIFSNYSTAEKFPKIIAPWQLDLLKKYSKNFIDRKEVLINQRIKSGKIRDCHGDLRLEHVYFLKKEVCIYDCIEFNDSFRYIDYANDLAFLLMDFDALGLEKTSTDFAKNIFNKTKDEVPQDLLDFYKCYRASVRLKVHCLRSGESEVSQKEKKESIVKAKDFLRLSLRYACLGSEPIVILVMGKVGTGKSTIAAAIADQLSIKNVSSDKIRKGIFCLDPTAETSPEIKKELYSSATTAKVYNELKSSALRCIKNSQSIVIDATFSSVKIRKHFIDSFSNKGLRYLFVEVVASDEVIQERLKNRSHNLKKTDVKNYSDATLKDKKFLDEKYDFPSEVPKRHYYRSNTDESLQKCLYDFYSHLISG